MGKWGEVCVSEFTGVVIGKAKRGCNREYVWVEPEEVRGVGGWF